MSKPEPQIMGLFPEPVGRYHVWSPSWQQPLHTIELDHRVNHSYSRDDRVLNQFPELKSTMQRLCDHFVQQVMGMDLSVEISQSWINRYEQGQSIHQHNHPNSLVSATWYWQLDSEAEILFHRHALNSGHTWTMKFDRSSNTNSPYAPQITSIRVAQGDLIIWPSYLVHSVPAWPEPEPRLSLSLNAGPRSWGSDLYRSS